MNEWLFVLTPIIILLIVTHLGGICEPFSAAPSTNSPTQDFPTTVAGIAGLIAFWKLEETTGTVAADSQGKDTTHPNGANPGIYKTSTALFYNGGNGGAAPHPVGYRRAGDRHGARAAVLAGTDRCAMVLVHRI